jgi:DNA-binding MarR family transcriptional regulator
MTTATCMTNEPDTPIPHFENHLCYWLQFVADHVTARLARELEEHDITVNEWVVLRTLFDAPCLPHHVLTRLLGMTRTATWKAVRRLEARGFIRRELARGEARLQGLSLTEQGEALVPQLAALADDNEFRLFLHLPPGLHKSLIRTLQAVATRHQFGFRHIPRRLKNRPANGL